MKTKKFLKIIRSKRVNIKNIGEDIVPISDEEETAEIDKGGKKDQENSSRLLKSLNLNNMLKIIVTIMMEEEKEMLIIYLNYY